MSLKRGRTVLRHHREKVYEPIELALFVGSAARPATVAGSLAETPEQVIVPAKSRPGRRALADRRSTDQEQQTTAAAGKDKEMSSIPETLSGPRPMESAVAKVRALVAGLGGTVSAERHPADSPLAAFLEIEIPTAGYILFCSRLQSLGALRDSPPDIDSTAALGVRIHLGLLTQPDDPTD